MGHIIIPSQGLSTSNSGPAMRLAKCRAARRTLNPWVVISPVGLWSTCHPSCVLRTKSLPKLLVVNWNLQPTQVHHREKHSLILDHTLDYWAYTPKDTGQHIADTIVHHSTKSSTSEEHRLCRTRLAPHPLNSLARDAPGQPVVQRRVDVLVEP
jgi:hypothetical protein